MVQMQRPNQRSSSGLVNRQLLLGILLGALVMNLWMQNEIDTREVQIHQQQLASMERKESALPIGASNTADTELEGWHPINVFYGERKGLFNDAPESIKESQESYSQVGQDSIVLDLMGSNGYFIDLAANDALDQSNSLALERKGWDGLCVEPNPVYWYGLSHRKCTVVGTLAGGSERTKVKVKFRGVFGGIVGKYSAKLANYKKEPDAPEETRYTAPIVEILKKFNVPKTIDYMSLDVEGSEYEVMESFPFETYTIRLMTVERPNKKLQKLLKEKGYIFLTELATWGEYLWCHKSTGFSPEDEKIKRIKPRT